MSGAVTEKPPSPAGESLLARLAPPSNRRNVFYFCIVNLLWWAGLYLYAPVLPVYIQLSGANLDMVGVVLSAYAIPQIILRIPVGLWSDRLGRRKPLVITGIIMTSLGALGLGLAKHPWLLFLGRMTTGIGAATWVVFPLYFTAFYPARESGRAIGLINFVRSVALIGASAGGGFLAEEFGMRQTFFSAVLLGVFAMAALAFTREQSLPAKRAASYQDFLSVATHPRLLIVSVIGIILNIAVFGGLFGFLPIYAAKIGASSSQLGLITMIHMGFSALGALAAVWFWQRLGYRAALVWSAAVSGLSLLPIPFISDVFLLMATQITYGLASGALMTILMTLSIHGVPPENQATAMGVFQAVYAVGMLVGPLICGFLSVELGLPSVFFTTAALTLSIVILAFLPALSRDSTQAATG